MQILTNAEYAVIHCFVQDTRYGAMVIWRERAGQQEGHGGSGREDWWVGRGRGGLAAVKGGRCGGEE